MASLYLSLKQKKATKRSSFANDAHLRFWTSVCSARLHWSFI